MSPTVAQGCLDPAAAHGSACRGAPAAHNRTGEVIGAAESDPNRTEIVRGSNQNIDLMSCLSVLLTPLGGSRGQQIPPNARAATNIRFGTLAHVGGRSSFMKSARCCFQRAARKEVQ